MNDKNTGGPAFPTPIDDVGNHAHYNHVDSEKNGPGMTLRDYFAAKAMQAMIREYFDLNGPSFGDGHNKGLYHNLPSHAYKMADAMLAARNQ
jgi:hypothetical protein